ncbi:MAG: Gfo/Idh/MocA family oxidoreductase [Verrucomicrobiota bacterium]|nr:Gfo/Idh/MocA family oxidoreductase [Verrucomicrobiota bacterium]
MRKTSPCRPRHWFWDREKSGGIFIEHGVHFFDLFEWWLGPGKVLAAQQVQRPGSALIEHVSCTVLYRDSALVQFYHGFHQPTRGSPGMEAGFRDGQYLDARMGADRNARRSPGR